MVAQPNCAASKRRPVSLTLVAFVLAGFFQSGFAARGDDADTEHLFGFTEGADIGKRGERELETETIGRFGKSAGSYAGLTQNNEAKIVPVDNLRLGAKATIAYFDISGVPGLADRGRAALQGILFEARYTLLERNRYPFALTVIAEPRWSRVDDTGGEPITGFGGLLTVAMDRELIAGRLFGAFNVLYDSEASHFHISIIRHYQSRIGMSAGLSARVQPAFFVGGEIRYLRAYDGLALDAFSGQAVFAGPTMYLQLSKRLAMSAAWNRQIFGRSTAGGGTMDLTHFERQQAKIRVNLNF